LKGAELWILTSEMSTGALTHFEITGRWKLLVTGLRISTGEETWCWNVNGQGLALSWFSKRERHIELDICSSC
jgi:hypothetical protein